MKAVSVPTLLGGLAAATAALSLAGLAALNTGASIGVGRAAFGLTEGYDEAANRHLTAKPADLDRAERKAQQALALSPYDANARLRLAYIDRQRHGRLTAQGAQHIATSYRLMPTDPNTAAWRIAFALDNWTSLTPDTRAAVYEEVRAFHALRASSVNIRDILRATNDPSGRVAAALWLQGLDAKAH